MIEWQTILYQTEILGTFNNKVIPEGEDVVSG